MQYILIYFQVWDILDILTVSYFDILYKPFIIHRSLLIAWYVTVGQSEEINLVYTYIILHYDSWLYTIQTPIFEPGFKANKIINNFIHWKLKENRDYSAFFHEQRLSMSSLLVLSFIFTVVSHCVNAEWKWETWCE